MQQRPTRRPVQRRRRRSLRLGALDGRLRYGFAAVCTLLLVIGGRLVQLQGLDHGGYAGAAMAQRVDTLALHALRGQILDRNGVPLAYTSDAQDITADPQQVRFDERLDYANKLSPLLGVPAAQLVTLLSGKSQYAMLGQGLSPAAAQKVTDLKLAGIYTQATTQRQYPARTTGANVVGFVHGNGTGAAGIEQTYNDVLAGQDGSQTYWVDNLGNVNPSSRTSTKPARNGADVRLTIDQSLQYTAQRALDVAVPESGARGAEMAVLDAHTGQVLALASSGTYDSSDPVIDSNTSMNPPVMSAFEPGSVQKAITFAAAVQEKKITPQTTLSVPDSIDTGGVTVRDAWAHKTERFTATGVLAESSNVGTLKIANLLGPTTWFGYEKRFGVGTKTGIELPGESGGYLPPLSQWSASTFANLPFGQGESMTVLQLASIYQTFANNGVRVPPRIVSSVTKADGSVSATQQPAGVRVIDAATARTVRTMLESVTLPGGTGKKAAIPGYRVAGKTGTAQQPDPAHGGAYSSYMNWDTFAGMVPADDPQFVVAIMVDNPAHGVEGGDVAAPLFNQIASYELQHAAIPPTGSLSRHVPLQDCAGQDRRFLPANVC
ncbi:MAG TPA: penicillin-binding protein 2 [Jatrophihabitans sp.]|uniref:peptidoglycan D,D-transpeptidase FtsI family protein n=1 Tax=Jatrophihabitans sp. TaxID=1932789 RepID=UPI002E064689|nr:penicillin-binding protein 2 [Jatrophihabitans sp.]